MDLSIADYSKDFTSEERDICLLLMEQLNEGLPEASSKIWHAHPVWFLEENPIVGYSKQKAGIRLMFWSGASFEEDGLNVRGAKFKDASVIYKSKDEIKIPELRRWLEKSKEIQWDYKNIVKRKGKLERLK